MCAQGEFFPGNVEIISTAAFPTQGARCSECRVHGTEFAPVWGRDINEETRMEAKAKLLGHPIHQMLIVFPLGLLAMGVIFDLIFFGTDNGMFAAVAYWMMVAGIVGGLLAAPFGFID